MRHEHKSGAWFELPDDVTQPQLELYEKTAWQSVKDKDVSDSLAARAALLGAFKAEIIEGGGGVPLNEKELDDASARVVWWMARKIGEFIADLKTIDPN